MQTDAGLARDNNEDSAVFDNLTGLAVLADGMGGYNAGEVASGMATAFIESELSNWLAQTGRNANSRELRQAVETCVSNANRAIFNASIANAQYAGMGTTLVLGVFRDDQLILGHIGDSRCYCMRNNQLVQLTKDHSLLQEQVDAGLITRAQAAFSGNRNLVTRALGVDNTVLLEINEYKVEAADLYLMCSDGLSDMVDDGNIARILANDASLEQKAVQLIDAANANGGRDNISVVLARAKAKPKSRGLFSKLMDKIVF